MKDELQNIISGKSKVKFGQAIQTATSYLRRSEKTSTLAKNDKYFKSEETERLIIFIEKNKLWIPTIDFDKFVSEGAEQRVYLHGGEKVIKLNDSIYYVSWVDYLNNLLLNNFFFPDTAYNLKGFYQKDSVLYAVVEQTYVRATQKTDLKNVKSFLNQNGFENTKNNDYYNKDLGIIVEDLHDENVLTKDDILCFIDTVFYLTDEFYLE